MIHISRQASHIKRKFSQKNCFTVSLGNQCRTCLLFFYRQYFCILRLPLRGLLPDTRNCHRRIRLARHFTASKTYSAHFFSQFFPPSGSMRNLFLGHFRFFRSCFVPFSRHCFRTHSFLIYLFRPDLHTTFMLRSRHNRYLYRHLYLFLQNLPNPL